MSKLIELSVPRGAWLGRVIEIAKEISIKESGEVFFFFNGIECRVNRDTPKELLIRDYRQSLRFDRPVIGPDCKPFVSRGARRPSLGFNFLPPDTSELDVEGDWEETKRSLLSKVTFSAFSSVLTTAEVMGKRLQKQPLSQETIKTVFREAKENLGVSEVTLQMATQLLIKYWRQGEELKKLILPPHKKISLTNCIL